MESSLRRSHEEDALMIVTTYEADFFSIALSVVDVNPSRQNTSEISEANG
jgi:hypothetical protein